MRVSLGTVSYTHLDVYKRQAMKRQQMYKTAEGRAILKLQEGDTHHGGCGHCSDN